MDAASYLLLVTLLRNGTLTHGDVEAMARQLDHEGESDRAHDVRSALVEAMGDGPEWHRARLTIVPDGGNSKEG